MPNTTEKHVDNTDRVLLKADEVARRLSLGRATVYQMIASGELRTVRRGRAVRVPVRSIDEWVERQIQRGQNTAA